MPSSTYLIRSPIHTLSDALLNMSDCSSAILGIERATPKQVGEVLQSGNVVLPVGQQLSYKELLEIVITQKNIVTL